MLQPTISLRLFWNVQRLQIHSRKRYQSRVGNLIGEVKNLQVGQTLKMHQARVGDPGACEVKIVQIGQIFEMHQARVGDIFTTEEGKLLQVCQLREVLQASVGDLAGIIEEVDAYNLVPFVPPELGSCLS